MRSNTFLKNNAIFWVASLGVSILNYLYYPILGRLMAPADFGEIQTIISFFTQIGIFLQVLGLLSIGIINKYDDVEVRDKLMSELSRLALMLSACVFILSIFAAPLLVSFFHFSSIAPFIALGFSLLVSVPLSFANSYLQGHKRFGTLSQSNILGAFGKIGFSVILVLAGFKAFGAVAGLILAQTVVLIFALSKGRGILHFVESNFHLARPRLTLIKPEMPYALMVFATSLTTNLLLSLDILVVKHYFPPAQAGLYTGISIIANTMYFLTGPLAMVLMPSVRQAQSNQENRRLLFRSLGMCAVIGGAALAVFVAIPHLLITILLGHKYAVYAGYLPKLSIALFLLSLANLVIYYNVALRRYLVAPVVLIGLTSTGWLLSRAHATMGAVVNDLLGGAVILVILLALMSIIPLRRFAWANN